VQSQTGDINVLNSAVEVAQDSLQAQWTLLKNELKAIMLDDKLVKPMKDLVRYMKEHGGIQDLTDALADLMLTFIKFWKEGGFNMLINGAKTFMGILKGVMPIMLALGKVLLFIAENEGRLFSTILIMRLLKAGTLLNRLVTSLMTYIVLQRMAAGGAMGPGGSWLATRFVDPTYLLLASGKGVMSGGVGRLGGQTALTDWGLSGTKKIPKVGAGLLSGGALGGVLGLVGLAAGIGIMAYMASKSARDMRDAGYAANLAARNNTVNINGDIYGFDNFDAAVQSSNRYTYTESRRYW
jgi:hypothetical protein